MPVMTSAEKLGWKRGHEEGLQEGLQAGKREALREILRDLLEIEIPKEASGLYERIAGIDELDRLQAVRAASRQVSSAAELERALDDFIQQR